MTERLQLQVVEEADTTAGLGAAIREGLCACFPEDRTVFSRTREWHGSGPSWSVIIEMEGLMAAHVGVVDRTVKAGGELVRVAGIQNLFVRPQFRSRGLAKAVVERAMEEAARRAFECGLLFCVPELAKLYSDCRWRILPRERVVRVDEEGREVELPPKNIAMYFPLKRSAFPPGPIHLQGNDW